VLLHHAGRRLALPCERVALVNEPGECFTAFLGTTAARAALALAPLVAIPAPPPAQPQRGLLLCHAGGLDFALAVEEVVAVIPPLPPTPVGAAGTALRGVCAHRGDILPVVDAGERLGGPPALGAGPVPLLRLAGARPVALAVAAVAGLRQVPEADLALVRAGLPGLAPGLVLALARFAGSLLPVLCAAALAASPAPAAAILASVGDAQ
jgi:chemotaxis signal transduction protein